MKYNPVLRVARQAQYYWGGLRLWLDESAYTCGQLSRLNQIRDLLEPLIGPLVGKRILDLGCGRLFPMTTLLTAMGVTVIGLDRCLVSPHAPLLRRFCEAYRVEGTIRLGKEVVTVLLKWRYWRMLSVHSGLNLPPRVPLVRGDAHALPFADETFDAVVSVAVLEHIRDIRCLVEETYRILKRGGACYHAIHLFPSLSGGHHPYWHNPAAASQNGQISVPAWDHLRTGAPLFDVSLNRLRKADYITAFQQRFVVWPDQESEIGAHRFLTASVRQEIPNCCSDDDLLTRTLILVGVKESAGSGRVRVPDG